MNATWYKGGGNRRPQVFENDGFPNFFKNFGVQRSTPVERNLVLTAEFLAKLFSRPSKPPGVWGVSGGSGRMRPGSTLDPQWASRRVSNIRHETKQAVGPLSRGQAAHDCAACSIGKKTGAGAARINIAVQPIVGW